MKHLGKKTKYSYDKPNPKLLDRFKNKHQDTVYLIPFVQERDEFTSLCPATGQPDHAKIEIIYVPNEWCVESKALKLYLMSFRNHGEFHEDVVNRIMKDLNSLLKPLYIRVFGDFASRGGLAIKPLTEIWATLWVNDQHILNMIRSWDVKKGNL